MQDQQTGEWGQDEPYAQPDPFADWGRDFQPPQNVAAPDPTQPSTSDRSTPAPNTTPPGTPTSSTEPVGGGGKALPPVIAPSAYAAPGNPEDAFFQTLASGNFTKGASQRGAGFFAGGNDYRGNLGGIADAFNKSHPGANAHMVGDDKIDFGDGKGPIDVITEGGDFWYNHGGSGGGTSGVASGAAGGGGAASAGEVGGGSYNAEIHDAIMALLKRGSSPVTEGDVASQYAPVSRTYQRAATHAKEAASERLAYEGLNSGGESPAADAEGNKIEEDLAGQQGTLMATLIGDELKARRQDVFNAIQYAQGEEKIALQMQLAQIDKDLRQQSLGLQGKQLDQQNSQFYDNMDYNRGRDEYLFSQIYGQGLGS